MTTTEEGEFQYPEAFKANWKGLPGKVFELRRKLYRKAKNEPKFRFYTLYDRIYRSDVLAAAWKQVSGNGGAPGVDGISIEALEKSEGHRSRCLSYHTCRRQRAMTLTTSMS